MRAVLLAICVSLVATAAAADPLQCKNLKRQVDHFEMLRDRADAADSALWQQRFDQQLAYLKNQRRHIGCRDKTAALEAALAQMRELMKLAAEGALTFFTGGAM